MFCQLDETMNVTNVYANQVAEYEEFLDDSPQVGYQIEQFYPNIKTVLFVDKNSIVSEKWQSLQKIFA